MKSLVSSPPQVKPVHLEINALNRGGRVSLIQAGNRRSAALAQRRVLLGGQREDGHCRVAVMRRSLKSSKWMIEL